MDDGFDRKGPFRTRSQLDEEYHTDSRAWQGWTEKNKAGRQAVDFIVNKGLSQAEVCRLLEVRSGTVSRWMKAYRRGGDRALAAHKHPGPKPKLTVRQRHCLAKRLLDGPQANGYPTDIWTCPRIADLIAQRYGVHYHVDHIVRLLRGLDFTPQRPQRQAAERDPAAVAAWIAKDWPRIEKTPLAGMPV